MVAWTDVIPGSGGRTWSQVSVGDNVTIGGQPYTIVGGGGTSPENFVIAPQGMAWQEQLGNPTGRVTGYEPGSGQLTPTQTAQLTQTTVAGQPPAAKTEYYRVQTEANQMPVEYTQRVYLPSNPANWMSQAPVEMRPVMSLKEGGTGYIPYVNNLPMSSGGNVYKQVPVENPINPLLRPHTGYQEVPRYEAVEVPKNYDMKLPPEWVAAGVKTPLQNVYEKTGGFKVAYINPEAKSASILSPQIAQARATATKLQASPLYPQNPLGTVSKTGLGIPTVFPRPSSPLEVGRSTVTPMPESTGKIWNPVTPLFQQVDVESLRIKPVGGFKPTEGIPIKGSYSTTTTTTTPETFTRTPAYGGGTSFYDRDVEYYRKEFLRSGFAEKGFRSFALWTTKPGLLISNPPESELATMYAKEKIRVSGLETFGWGKSDKIGYLTVDNPMVSSLLVGGLATGGLTLAARGVAGGAALGVKSNLLIKASTAIPKYAGYLFVGAAAYGIGEPLARGDVETVFERGVMLTAATAAGAGVYKMLTPKVPEFPAASAEKVTSAERGTKDILSNLLSKSTRAQGEQLSELSEKGGRTIIRLKGTELESVSSIKIWDKLYGSQQTSTAYGRGGAFVYDKPIGLATGRPGAPMKFGATADWTGVQAIQQAGKTPLSRYLTAYAAQTPETQLMASRQATVKLEPGFKGFTPKSIETIKGWLNKPTEYSGVLTERGALYGIEQGTSSTATSISPFANTAPLSLHTHPSILGMAKNLVKAEVSKGSGMTLSSIKTTLTDILTYNPNKASSFDISLVQSRFTPGSQHLVVSKTGGTLLEKLPSGEVKSTQLSLNEIFNYKIAAQQRVIRQSIKLDLVKASGLGGAEGTPLMKMIPAKGGGFTQAQPTGAPVFQPLATYDYTLTQIKPPAPLAKLGKPIVEFVSATPTKSYFKVTTPGTLEPYGFGAKIAPYLPKSLQIKSQYVIKEIAAVDISKIARLGEGGGGGSSGAQGGGGGGGGITLSLSQQQLKSFVEATTSPRAGAAGAGFAQTFFSTQAQNVLSFGAGAGTAVMGLGKTAPAPTTQIIATKSTPTSSVFQTAYVKAASISNNYLALPKTKPQEPGTIVTPKVGTGTGGGTGTSWMTMAKTGLDLGTGSIIKVGNPLEPGEAVITTPKIGSPETPRTDLITMPRNPFTSPRNPIIPPIIPPFIPGGGGGGAGGKGGGRKRQATTASIFKSSIRVKADPFSRFLTKAVTGKYAQNLLQTKSAKSLYKSRVLGGKSAFAPTLEQLKSPEKFGGFGKYIKSAFNLKRR